MKKFDFIIGNPPFDEETENNGRRKPLYHLFMQSSYKIGNTTILIHPSRFLFNAGQTPKNWNKEILSDKHFKVLKYEENPRVFFPMNEIKGGVAITIRDKDKNYGEVGIFTGSNIVDSILNKVIDRKEVSISDFISKGVPYKFTNKIKEDYPDYIKLISKSFDLRTNVFEKLQDIVFYFDKNYTTNPIKIYGLINQKRVSMYVNSEYIDKPKDFYSFRLLIPKAVGSGNFGEAFPEMIIAKPSEGHTQSFLSIGSFCNEKEVINLEKYIKTKLSRTLLSILKVTQDITPSKWKYVPLQDFTENSDIDWSQSIAEIDQQLYKKYGLSPEEIDFIEEKVQEMK